MNIVSDNSRILESVTIELEKPIIDEGIASTWAYTHLFIEASHCNGEIAMKAALKTKMKDSTSYNCIEVSTEVGEVWKIEELKELKNNLDSKQKGAYTLLIGLMAGIEARL